MRKIIFEILLINKSNYIYKNLIYINIIINIKLNIFLIYLIYINYMLKNILMSIYEK